MSDVLSAEELLSRRGVSKVSATAAAVPSSQDAMFRGLIGEIALASQDGSEADPVGVHACLLAIAGALAGTGPHVRIGNKRHPMLVWPLLLGRTGSGRKGEATGTALRLGHAASQELGWIYATGLSTGEGLIERIRDVDGPEDGGGTEDKRLLVVEEEMARVMAVSGRENTTLPAIMRGAWEGAALGTMTKTKPVRASQSHIAVIGNITPAEFRSKVKAADMAGGTWNRFLPVYVERRRLIANPQGFSDDELTSYGARLRDAIRAAHGRGTISLSPEANQVWVESIYPEFAAFDEDTRAADFVQRAAPYTRRIAALYAALDGRSLVSVDDLDAAAMLVRYSIASAEYTFDGSPRDVKADKLRRAVDEAGPAGLSSTAISKVFGGHLRADDLAALCDKLIASTAYADEDITTAGRSARMLYSVKLRNVRKSETSPLTSHDGEAALRSAAEDAKEPEGLLRKMRKNAEDSEAVTSGNVLLPSDSLLSQSPEREARPTVAKVPARCRSAGCKKPPTTLVGRDWLCSDHAKSMTPKSGGLTQGGAA